MAEKNELYEGNSIVKLEIIEKNNYLYTLQSKDNHKYIINMEFIDIAQNPEQGDYIYINKELLNPQYDGFSNSYTFGSIDNKYGRKNILTDDIIDVIKITKKGKSVYLKRLYG